MAYVHIQVNATSRVYLQSERRYNYTTPKSFLEQISLYSKLLQMKSAELASKVDRLENGLEKLKNTAEQVCIVKLTGPIKVYSPRISGYNPSSPRSAKYSPVGSWQVLLAEVIKATANTEDSNLIPS